MKMTKNIFRKNCIKNLKSQPQHNKLYRDKKVNQRLLKLLNGVKNKTILFYYPLGFEADIRDSLKKLRKTNKIYIPFMQLQSFKMVTFRLPLYKKQFGILEAGNTHRKINKVDIAIVPVIGVDGNFQRVGFGKGMYDRFFASLKHKPFTIFVQSKLCYTNEKVCDLYDISSKTLISSTKTISKK